MVARERHAAQGGAPRPHSSREARQRFTVVIFDHVPERGQHEAVTAAVVLRDGGRHAKIAVGPVQVPDDVLAVQPAHVLWTGLKDASRIGSAQADGVP